ERLARVLQQLVYRARGDARVETALLHGRAYYDLTARATDHVAARRADHALGEHRGGRAAQPQYLPLDRSHRDLRRASGESELRAPSAAGEHDGLRRDGSRRRRDAAHGAGRLLDRHDLDPTHDLAALPLHGA